MNVPKTDCFCVSIHQLGLIIAWAKTVRLQCGYRKARSQFKPQSSVLSSKGQKYSNYTKFVRTHFEQTTRTGHSQSGNKISIKQAFYKDEFKWRHHIDTNTMAITNDSFYCQIWNIIWFPVAFDSLCQIQAAMEPDEKSNGLYVSTSNSVPR